jgi:uncharacterized membrane protein YedE/YeeE
LPSNYEKGNAMQDWIWGFAGGLMIGCASAIFLLFNGKVMGASSIIGELVDRTGLDTWAERTAFLVGLIAMPAVMAPKMAAETHLTQNVIVVIIAGLLVGLGTRLASGCTTGHGVCGISRLSLRGILSTVIYLLAGGATMAVLRHALGAI